MFRTLKHFFTRQYSFDITADQVVQWFWAVESGARVGCIPNKDLDWRLELYGRAIQRKRRLHRNQGKVVSIFSKAKQKEARA